MKLVSSGPLDPDLLKAVTRMAAANEYLERQITGGSDLQKLRLAVEITKSSVRWLEEAGALSEATNQNCAAMARGVGLRIGASKLCEEATEVLRKSFGIIPGGRDGK